MINNKKGPSDAAGTVALAEGMGNPSPEHIKAKVASGHLTSLRGLVVRPENSISREDLQI